MSQRLMLSVVDYKSMPTLWRFLPRLLWGLGKRVSHEPIMPNLEVRARLPNELMRINVFAALVGHRAGELPPTWPAGVMTPLLAALVSHRRFPFPAIGLIHRQEEISVLRGIERTDELHARVRLGECRGTSAGICFDIRADVFHGDELVWASRSEILYRTARLRSSRTHHADAPLSASEVHWLDVDLEGVRAYAAASGNRDPIHTSPVLARSMGMPGAIMHGLWTLGRASSFLPPREPPYRLRIQFRRPLVVPGRAGWAIDREGDGFSVVCPEGGKPFAVGSRHSIDREAAG